MQNEERGNNAPEGAANKKRVLSEEARQRRREIFLKVRANPEMEARRIEGVKRAFKGHSPTEAQRKARAEGLRRAYANGLKVARNPEAWAKTAAKLRGRKRPPEVVEKVRLANLGKKRTPEQIAAMVERQKAIRAAGGMRMSPETRARVNAILRESRKGWKPSEEQRRRHSEMMTGRPVDPELAKRRALPMKGRPQKAELTKAGPTHHGSREGVLRDPRGRAWPFKNLCHFVRTHPDLFDPKDLELLPKVRGGGLSLCCKAAKRLSGLFGKSNHAQSSWKGWTVVSEYEQQMNYNRDLLARTSIEEVPEVEQQKEINETVH